MIVVASPLSGWVSPLLEVPDPVFAEAMLGDGLAIDPTEGLVRAPVSGTVETVHAAGHAVTIAADDGPMLLIHVGLETVALGGAGFTVHVAPGDRVATGAPLIGFDMDAVGRKARSLVTPVILTNGDAFRIAERRGEGLVAAGAPLFSLLPVDAAKSPVAGVTGTTTERALLLPLRHGLHARPAARLAECARGFDAVVTLVASDGREAPLTSPVAMLALALRHGAAIRLRARGPEAGAAVTALAGLIEGGMGEGVPVTDVEQARAQAPLPEQLTGVAAAPGFAIGLAWRPPEPPGAAIEAADDPQVERVALAEAIDGVRAELAASAEEGGAAGSIAAAHLGFLADAELLASADRSIAAGKSAGFAWQAAIEHFATMLSASGDPRFAERVADLRDLSLRVRAALAGETAPVLPPEGAILIAEEVLPSQLMSLSGKGLAGIASGGGGPTSHAAIIAASQGLPMVAALGSDVARIAAGTMVLLDADQGLLAIDPPAALIAERRAEASRKAAFRVAAEAHAAETAVTRDGTRIEVCANLGSVADAHAAIAAGAEGCGLLRTEFAFLDRPSPPDENEQAALYQAIADALEGRPLIARTLDIGADKPAPWLPMAPEENPALGLRGIRIGLRSPDLLRTQLRALLRVEGDVRIMLPMVVEPGEVAMARAILAEEAVVLGRIVPSLGVMVETPAAAVLAAQLATNAEFFSIGSNDLSQYALAMDRGNPGVAGRIDGLHPAVLRLIAQACAGAKVRGRPVGVCGGIAADPLAVPLLIGLGVGELSVPPAAVPVIKAHVRACERNTCAALAARALEAASAAEIRAMVRAFQLEVVP